MVLAPANVIVDEEGGSKTTGEDEMINESKDQQVQEEELPLENASTDEIQEAKEVHTDEENDKQEYSEDEEESEQLSDTTEDYSMESDAYTKWPAEGTDSSYSSLEEEYGMKSSFDIKRDSKEPPTNRNPEQRRVLGIGSQEALGKEKEVVLVKGSKLKLYFHLTLSLVLLAGFLLLLDRHHDRTVETYHLHKVLYPSNSSS